MNLRNADTGSRSNRRDLFAKVLQTVFLQAGFYAIGVGLAAGLLALPVVQLSYEGQVSVPGFVAGWVGLWILWALIPPRRRDEEPGPNVTLETEPELLRLIEEVAEAIGVRVPDEVFIYGDANAFVAPRRRLFRVRRVLALGLPLFDLLTVDQMTGVIAHELGHLHRGDIRLGPWIYGTRQAMLSTLKKMDQEGIGLHLIFHWYARWYVRVSQSVSRQQELHADRIAAGIVGGAAYVDALRVLDRVGQQWAAYWYNEVVPVLECGLRPPLVDGFRVFRSGPLARFRDEPAPVGQRDTREDSHPELAVREAALEDARGHRLSSGRTEPASRLLSDLESAEARLIRFCLVGHAELPVLEWGDVGTRVWVNRWREEVAPYRGALAALSPRDFARAIEDIELWTSRFRQEGPSILSPGAANRRALSLLGMWFCTVLDAQGWMCVAKPGYPITFEKDAHSIEPFDLVDRMARGAMQAEEWCGLCRQYGV